MGSSCCVPVKDKALLPSTPAAAPSYSPAWNCSWDIELGTPHQSRVNACSQAKAAQDVGGLSDRSSRRAFQMLLSSASEPSMGSSSFMEATHFVELSVVADSSVSRLRSPSPLTSSPCSISSGDLSFQRYSPTAASTSWQARHSPGHHPRRQSCDVRQTDLRSPNYSISEGSPSFILSTCSNDLTVGSQGGRSSDCWSMSPFSELVTSQKERWSFDSENLDCVHGKIIRPNGCFLVSSSFDFQTCGVCCKLLNEKSPWVAHKITCSTELSVVAVLACGHVYHAECLENKTPETYSFDPSCPVCTTGDRQALRFYEKNVKIDSDPKARNKISRNRVVDSNIDFNDIVPDQWRGTRRMGKNPMSGSNSSMKNSLVKPFLWRHFSLGSKSCKSVLQKEFCITSSGKKGFWSRYRME